MPKITNRAAYEKIIRARTNLLISNGFFGFLALQLNIVERLDISTAAVDGVSMYYNPNFINDLDDRECEFVVAHEVMHCCFQHFSRRGHRDPMGWNIAGDFVINLDLQKAGFKLIPKGKILNGKPCNILIDTKYEGMSSEDVYELLPKITINMSGGRGNGQAGGDDMDPGGCGGVWDTPGGANEKAAASHEWETQVRQAVAVAAANNVGQVPASLRRLITSLNKPKVSWRDKTRNFVDQSLIKDVSWARLSRRSFTSGTLMPGLISDRLNHLVFVVDTSGSVNDELYRAFLSETAGALDEGTADQMTVLYADTRVHDVDHYVSGDIVMPRSLDKGGGGTAFSDSFRHIKEHIPDASAIIYLTDLQVHDFGEDLGIPTLWAVYAPDSIYDQLAANAPFGECIQVSNSLG